MINENTISEHNIFSLTKSAQRSDGLVLFLGKSMEGYFIVVAQDEVGNETEPLIFSSYAKARSAIRVPSRMIPIFKKENHMQDRCDCCGQVLKK